MPWAEGFGTFNRLWDFFSSRLNAHERKLRRMDAIKEELRDAVFTEHDLDRVRTLRAELDRLLDETRRRT